MSVHIPVMLKEVGWHVGNVLFPKGITKFASRPLICDATFGEGHYTRYLLENFDCQVLAVDRDPLAIKRATELESASKYRGRIIPVHGKFSELRDIVHDNLGSGAVLAGVVLDLGVSTNQLLDPSRGFSFRLDGPLDMRMSSAEGREDPRIAPAHAVVNHSSEAKLREILEKYGDERQAVKIARDIVTARRSGPIMTTGQLSDIIVEAKMGRRVREKIQALKKKKSLAGASANDSGELEKFWFRTRVHPATKSFQAIRIFVNDELRELASCLIASEQLLKPDGLLVSVSFHSLEDRIIKRFLSLSSSSKPVLFNWKDKLYTRESAFQSARYRKISSEDISEVKVEDKPLFPQPTFQLVSKKVLKPSWDEIDENPRSRSAKLRAAVRSSEPAQERTVESFVDVLECVI
ncbi:MraW methylase family-domain-containing protein [Cladochytrium replicatum]|nr:MraW methylase family-domain-containing protein [Cladochytrium replicatum]